MYEKFHIIFNKASSSLDLDSVFGNEGLDYNKH